MKVDQLTQIALCLFDWFGGARDIEVLMQYDVILTTYATLSAEFVDDERGEGAMGHFLQLEPTGRRRGGGGRGGRATPAVRDALARIRWLRYEALGRQAKERSAGTEF